MQTAGSVRQTVTRPTRIIAATTATLALAAALTAATTPSARPPSVTNYSGELNGVTSISASDAWAVGDGSSVALRLLHWNGRNWTNVLAPNPGTISNNLNGVSAVSASDVWAVGTYDDPHNSKTLILRWNGTRWNRVPSPTFGTGSNISDLLGVSATSATDVWAVGDSPKPRAVRESQTTLILHWNGTSWARVPSPSLPESALVSVTSISASDAWAVGAYLVGGFRGMLKPLLLHWNGATWTRVAVPLPRKILSSGLFGVSADSPTNVWAVGHYYVTAGGRPLTLALHWDGTRWMRVATPTPQGASGGTLEAVTDVSADDAWAVGMGGNADRNALVLRWDGKRWTQVASPGPGGGASDNLSAVSAAGPGTAWAVGSLVPTNTIRFATLVLGCHRTKCTRS